MINEPDDAIICQGGGAILLTCVVNVAGTNIRNNNTQWYASTVDTSTTEKVNPYGNVYFRTQTNGSIVSTSLVIATVTKSYTGRFWVDTQSYIFCSTSVVVLASTYVHMNRNCIVCTYVCMPLLLCIYIINKCNVFT